MTHRRARLLEVALAAFPALLLLGLLVRVALGLRGYAYLGDFRVFRDAGGDVLAGRSPYPPADPALLAEGHSFVYPAPAAVALAPLALLPFTVGALLWTLASALAIPASLWIVGVRDWRCAAAALSSFWAGNALANGTVTPFLALGLALLWAQRDRVVTAAALAAALVVAKVFLTSAVVWLVVTRRLRLLALATVLAAAALLGSWAVIGFAGFRGYPHLLATLARAEQALSYSPLALGLDLGLRAAVARAAVAVLAAALLLACLRRRREDGRAFTWGILAALALSPIVWPHYCVVLFPVLGILRPRFDRVWLIPLASWLAVHPHSTGALETAVGIGVAAVTLLAAVRVPRLAPLREPLLEQS